MNYIRFTDNFQYDFIAQLRPGITAADIIEWITNWGPQEGKGWEWGPTLDQTRLWGERYELIHTREPGKYSNPDNDTYIGEWGRFTDSEGVTNLLFKDVKLEIRYGMDMFDTDIPDLRYGVAYFQPVKCFNSSEEQEKYDQGKCPGCRCTSPGSTMCKTCVSKYFT